MFIHPPLYQNSLHVKEIHDRAVKMLHLAKREIRITSPFIDMLYEDIINLKQQNPNIKIKIITRPRKDVTGLRERIARNVVGLLNAATSGGVVESPLIHARLVIIDDTEALISSADLTRDQLFDEFNAGILTSDKEVLRRATEFFENIYTMEQAKALE